MLDFTSHEKVLGKPVGSDLREGKVTLPLIYALEKATPEERQLVGTVLKDGNYDHAPFQQILRMIQAAMDSIACASARNLSPSVRGPSSASFPIRPTSVRCSR